VQAAPLDGPRFDAVPAAGRAYAEDQTLIFYCLRGADETGPFLYVGLHADIEAALKKLKAAGSDERQNALFVQAVLGTVRFASLSPKNGVLEPQCVDKDVEKSVAEIGGVAMPLFLRPPFDKLDR
jgi:hypothetical protein